MNGLDLYNFMYDQFVWPQYPFASRDVRHREGSPVSQEAAGEPSPCRDENPNCPYCGEPKVRHEYASRTSCVLGSVIVLADRRKDKT